MNDRTLLPARDVLPDVDPAALVAVSFLAAFPNANTRDAYRRDLRFFFKWRLEHDLHPLADVKRAHIQAYASHLLTARHNSPSTVIRRIGTLSGYYETGVLDDMLAGSPCHHIKIPKVQEDPTRRTYLNRWELAAVMKAAQESRCRADWALITLMGTLGMRVSATCNVQIEDLSETDDGYRFLHTIGKGSKPSLKVLPIPTWKAVERARDGRASGPLLQRRDGSQMNRRSATTVVERLCREAGVKRKISPHSFRRTFVTIALKAGVPIEVVQYDVDHRSVRTTMDYHREPGEPHSRSFHTVAALLASAS